MSTALVLYYAADGHIEQMVEAAAAARTLHGQAGGELR